MERSVIKYIFVKGLNSSIYKNEDFSNKTSLIIYIINNFINIFIRFIVVSYKNISI